MADKPRILVLNGPNLNLLGTREPEIYGSETLSDIHSKLETQASVHGVELDFRQSNAEHEITEWVQQARGDFDFILINPAAFTHTSVAIRDALLAVGIPYIEVHLSNPHSREPFRKHSYFSDAALGVLCGFGAQSYEFALSVAIKHLKNKH